LPQRPTGVGGEEAIELSPFAPVPGAGNPKLLEMKFLDKLPELSMPWVNRLGVLYRDGFLAHLLRTAKFGRKGSILFLLLFLLLICQTICQIICEGFGKPFA
jgi:hypothetical protein